MLAVLNHISDYECSHPTRGEKMSCGVEECGDEREIDIQRICAVEVSIDFSLLETQEPKTNPIECAVAKNTQIGWRSNYTAYTSNALLCQHLVYLGAVGSYYQTVSTLS